jgi:outer membrane protein
MRTITFSLLLAGLFMLPALSPAQQKIAYVDISAVMKALPDAQVAQAQLDALVDGWQKDLDKMQKDWQDKFNDYDKRKLILTDQGRASAEKELQDLERSIMEFRDKKFGQNGELFTKEDELMRPIQNIVFDQVKLLAKDMGYDYVLDKSGGVMMIYANEKHDLTKTLIDRITKLLPARSAPGQPGQTGPGGTQQTPAQDQRSAPDADGNKADQPGK